MISASGPRKSGPSTHRRPSTPSFCATQGTASPAASESSSGSRLASELLSDWHKVTDCSFQRWCAGASDYEKRCVAKMLGRTTAGKGFFERQLQAVLESPPVDPTVKPGQPVRLVYENPAAAGHTINQRWRPDYVLHPGMRSEVIAVRTKFHNWPVPPSRALN